MTWSVVRTAGAGGKLALFTTRLAYLYVCVTVICAHTHSGILTITMYGSESLQQQSLLEQHPASLCFPTWRTQLEDAGTHTQTVTGSCVKSTEDRRALSWGAQRKAKSIKGHT